jgi:hypothetical protein
VLVEDGVCQSSWGWNFVDYRDADPDPRRVFANVSIGPPPALPPGVHIVLDADPRHRGSWLVEGATLWHARSRRGEGSVGLFEHLRPVEGN